jgi:hypothetical protein
MRWIFWGFCRNWFHMSPLHNLSSRSDFGFEFAEIFVFEKPLATITNMGSRLLNFFKENSLYQWYGESSTPYTSDTVSCRLRASLIQRVDDSAYRWVGESTTPRIGDTESRYSKKKLIWCRFSELLTAKPCL